MNLGKLLGAGKTFFGGGNPAAYRQNKRIYLPKFNAEKNPFAPKPAEPAPAAAAPEMKKVSAPQFSTPFAAKTQKIPILPAAKPARAAWTTRLNPFRAPAPAAPPLAGAVQPELLSLDAVKVVHNDLADADIEIVPVKSRASAPVAAPLLSPAREAWEFMGESLLKPS
jgi:hypothetical protein